MQAITNIRLFDGLSDQLVDGRAVLLDNGRITSVISASDPLPEKCPTIDGADIGLATAIDQGLIDSPDLILLKDNPLVDLTHLSSLVWVMKNGKLLNVSSSKQTGS